MSWKAPLTSRVIGGSGQGTGETSGQSSYIPRTLTTTVPSTCCRAARRSTAKTGTDTGSCHPSGNSPCPSSPRHPSPRHPSPSSVQRVIPLTRSENSSLTPLTATRVEPLELETGHAPCGFVVAWRTAAVHGVAVDVAVWVVVAAAGAVTSGVL